MRTRVRNLLAEQEREVPFRPDRLALRKKNGLMQYARPILPIRGDDILSAPQRRYLSAVTPKRRVQPRVKPIVHSEKIAHVIPDFIHVSVGKIARGLRRTKFRILQAIRQ